MSKKRIIQLILMFLGLVLFDVIVSKAQPPNPAPVDIVNIDPIGSCQPGNIKYSNQSHSLWICNLNGVGWFNVTAGGGIGTVTSISITAGTGLTAVPNPIITTGTIACATASATVTGCLSSTKFTDFNNKLDGSGTTGTLPIWATATSLGDSHVTEPGGTRVNISLPVTVAGQQLNLGGSGTIGGGTFPSLTFTNTAPSTGVASISIDAAAGTPDTLLIPTANPDATNYVLIGTNNATCPGTLTGCTHTSYVSPASIVIAGGGLTGFPRLDQVLDPNSSKDFSMGANTLTLSSTDTTSQSMFALKNNTVQGPFQAFLGGTNNYAWGLSSDGHMLLREIATGSDPVTGTNILHIDAGGDLQTLGTVTVGALANAASGTDVDAQNTGIVNAKSGYSVPLINAAATGTTLHKLVCDNGSGAGVICPSASSTTNVPLGTVIGGAGTTGSATVQILGYLPIICDNASTALHWAIESTTADGEIHDVGTTEPTGQPHYFVWVGANAGDLAIIQLITPDQINAAGGSGGSNSIQINGTASKKVTNFNNTTPTAPTNGLNVTWNFSGSGNTTSASAAIVGDGTATHFLNGTGSFSAVTALPAGAANGDLVVFNGANWIKFAGNASGTKVLTEDASGNTSWGAGGGGGAKVVNLPIYCRNPRTQTLGGNAFWTVSAATNWDDGHWEFVNGADGHIYCSVTIPHNVDATPAASIIISLFQPTAGAGNVKFQTGDFVLANTGSYNGTFTTATAQSVAASSQWVRQDLTFAVQSTVAADGHLIIDIARIGSDGVNDTLAANEGMFYAVLQITIDN